MTVAVAGDHCTLLVPCLLSLSVLPVLAAAPSSLCGEPIFSIFQPFEKPPIQSIFYTPYAKQLRGHTNTRGACHILLTQWGQSLSDFVLCTYAIKAQVRKEPDIDVQFWKCCLEKKLGKRFFQETISHRGYLPEVNKQNRAFWPWNSQEASPMLPVFIYIMF